jgi:hypothetical protein
MATVRGLYLADAAKDALYYVYVLHLRPSYIIYRFAVKCRYGKKYEDLWQQIWGR